VSFFFSASTRRTALARPTQLGLGRVESNCCVPVSFDLSRGQVVVPRHIMTEGAPRRVEGGRAGGWARRPRRPRGGHERQEQRLCQGKLLARPRPGLAPAAAADPGPRPPAAAPALPCQTRGRWPGGAAARIWGGAARPSARFPSRSRNAKNAKAENTSRGPIDGRALCGGCHPRHAAPLPRSHARPRPVPRYILYSTGHPREAGEEGSCGGPVPAAVRASALFASTGPIVRPPSAPPSARALEASVLKAITSGLFDDEAENDTDEDSVAGLPALPPMKGRSVLRVRRSLDEVRFLFVRERSFRGAEVRITRGSGHPLLMAGPPPSRPRIALPLALDGWATPQAPTLGCRSGRGRADAGGPGPQRPALAHALSICSLPGPRVLSPGPHILSLQHNTP
jgi:hypothetical protein